ncbi:MAG: hypothetical protein GY820_01025, partial [Gammaproteobacteria bacterium]|nr:hypothetical protein [Gammaproteobacteria bacterium]
MVLCTDWFVVIRSAQLYEDVYMLCYLSTKAHVWKTLEQRALHMRESIEAQQPPFRYFGKPDAAHKDA